MGRISGTEGRVTSSTAFEEIMTLKKALIGVVFVVVAGPISIFLAIDSEGFAFQHRLRTPGLYVADRLLPPQSSGFNQFAESMSIAVSVDALIWFLIICGTVLIIARYRRSQKHRNRKSPVDIKPGGDR